MHTSYNPVLRLEIRGWYAILRKSRGQLVNNMIPSCKSDCSLSLVRYGTELLDHATTYHMEKKYPFYITENQITETSSWQWSSTTPFTKNGQCICANPQLTMWFQSLLYRMTILRALKINQSKLNGLNCSSQMNQHRCLSLRPNSQWQLPVTLGCPSCNSLNLTANKKINWI